MNGDSPVCRCKRPGQPQVEVNDTSPAELVYTEQAYKKFIQGPFPVWRSVRFAPRLKLEIDTETHVTRSLIAERHPVLRSEDIGVIDLADLIDVGHAVETDNVEYIRS